MGTSLINTKPQDTYPGLIKTTDNAAISATLKTLSDGNGNDFPMQISTTAVNFTGTLTQNGSPVTTPPSGVSGAIQFSNGSAFASDASNLFWDDTNNCLGVGTNSPSATAHFKGSGSTSATTSLLVQNSAGTQLMKVGNSGVSTFGGNIVNTGYYMYSSLFVGPCFLGDKYQINSNGFAVFGSDTILASAVLQADSTTKGFLPPRMTNAQRSVISSPAVGLMVYCTDAVEGLYVYKSTGWTLVI
jgi:hypothetical protein